MTLCLILQRSACGLATLLLALLALNLAVAHGNSFDYSEEDISVGFDELTFFGPIGQNIICEVTMDGTLHETQASKETTLLGHVTRGIVNEAGCEGAMEGFFLLAETLPWHIRYTSFEGTLPAIEAIFLTVSDVALAFTGGAIGTCLYEGEANFILVPEAEGTLVVFDESTSIPKAGGGVFCFASLRFGGTADLTELGEAAPVLVTLGEGEREEPTATVSPGGSIALESLDTLTLTGSGTRMSCEWELSGSLSRESVRLVEGAQLGSVTSTRADHCSGGSIESTLGTPWSLDYIGVTGTLPSEATAITVAVSDFAVDLRTYGVNVGCLYRGDLTGTLELSGANPYPTGLLRLTEPVLSLVSGARGCPSTTTATGTFWLGPEQSIRFE